MLVGWIIGYSFDTTYTKDDVQIIPVVLEEILVRIVLYNWTFDRFHMKTHKKPLPLSFSYTAVSSATNFPNL